MDGNGMRGGVGKGNGNGKGDGDAKGREGIAELPTSIGKEPRARRKPGIEEGKDGMRR